MYYFSLNISSTTLQKVSKGMPRADVPPLRLLQTTVMAMRAVQDQDGTANRFTFSATSIPCQTRFNNHNFAHKAYSVV